MFYLDIKKKMRSYLLYTAAKAMLCAIPLIVVFKKHFGHKPESSLLKEMSQIKHVSLVGAGINPSYSGHGRDSVAGVA